MSKRKASKSAKISASDNFLKRLISESDLIVLALFARIVVVT